MYRPVIYTRLLKFLKSAGTKYGLRDTAVFKQTAGAYEMTTAKKEKRENLLIQYAKPMISYNTCSASAFLISVNLFAVLC